MEDKNFVEVKNVHICLFENKHLLVWKQPFACSKTNICLFETKHLLVWKQPFACSKTYTGEEISS